MMKRRIGVLLVFCAITISFSTMAQAPTPCDYQPNQRASNWVFGDRSQLLFENNNPAEAYEVDAGFNILNGVAAISDENGNLLFFSDGIRLWSSGFYLFQGTTDLRGNDAATQSALFVPHPGVDNRIYLFTVDMYFPLAGFNNGIRYSTLERGAQGWNLVNKNALLQESNAQKITAVKHENGLHYWVITHGYDDTGDRFFAWLVDSTGVAQTAVQSTIGTIHRTDYSNLVTFNNNAGYMRASPDGSKIALTLPEDGVVEVFDFNTRTGQVTNVSSSGLDAFYYPFGVEFSPDNSKLYVSTSPRELNNLTSLFQLDLNDSNPFENPYTIFQSLVTQNADSLLGALQLGLDGRIYVARTRWGINSMSNLGTIYNPNRKGLECNYNHLLEENNGLPLNGGRTYQGLPNFVTSYLDIPHFNWINHCHQSPTIFALRNEANIDEINWAFSDAGAQSDQLKGVHTFSQPGNYTVSVTERYNGIPYSSSRDITIYPLPDVDIGQGGDTIYILPNSSITLDAGVFDAYEWSPGGSTDRFIDVEEQGWYYVTVTDTNCCVNTDSVYIAFSNVFLPTAFRPGSSIAANSSFKVLGATSALSDFRLYIYNRWGALVFETDNPDVAWDGRLANGEAAPMGTYAWVLFYESFGSSFQAPQKINQRGVVTLIR